MADLLPKKYEFSHYFAFFLHDILARIIVEGEKDKVFHVKYKFKSESETKLFEKLNLSGDELWEWLEKNNYKWVIIKLAKKQCLIALLSDFCHYIYESLTCSQKGKLTVSYTLLRKPFKENLLYLEWLLSDPVDFSNTFHMSSPNNLSLSSISKEKKIEIIHNAMSKTSFGNWIKSDFIYELRYEKKAHYGFESLWNQAAHLITDFNAYKTESENFNFVFSGEKEKISQWNHYYGIVPLLLFYSVEIINALIHSITNVKYEDSLTSIRRLIGFFLWSKETVTDNKAKILTKTARDILKKLDLHCPLCKKKISLGVRNLRLFFTNLELVCSTCGTEILFNQEYWPL